METAKVATPFDLQELIDPTGYVTDNYYAHAYAANRFEDFSNLPRSYYYDLPALNNTSEIRGIKELVAKPPSDDNSLLFIKLFNTYKDLNYQLKRVKEGNGDSAFLKFAASIGMFKRPARFYFVLSHWDDTLSNAGIHFLKAEDRLYNYSASYYTFFQVFFGWSLYFTIIDAEHDFMSKLDTEDFKTYQKNKSNPRRFDLAYVPLYRLGSVPKDDEEFLKSIGLTYEFDPVVELQRLSENHVDCLLKSQYQAFPPKLLASY